MEEATGLAHEPVSRTVTLNGEDLAPKRVVKYGTGKFSQIELLPQPSDSGEDPLNWPTWKKDLNLLGILFSVAMAGVLKTFLVTINSALAINMNVPYVKVSALSGVPLVLSAFTGVLSLIVSQTIGKRTVYLSSSIFMFIGTMWNMHAGNSYSQFMGARVFQGIGMGAFDTIVLSSIQDMYFEHERHTRTTLYNMVMLGTTWGSPILGGYLAQSADGVSNEFMIISIFQSFGIALLILVCNETAFYRSTTDSFPSKSEIEAVIPTTQKSKFSSYLSSLHPMPYYDSPTVTLLTQPLRYLASPKTALLFLMSGLLPATAFAIGNSLPLLYSTLPMMLFSTKIGYLFTLPLVFSLLSYFLLTTFFTSSNSTRTISAATNTATPPKPSPKKQLFITIPALLFGFSGLLAFGLYNSFHTHRITILAGVNHKVSAMLTGDSSMSLQVVSLLFGLAVAGGLMLQISASSYLTTSTSPTTRSALYTETSLQFYRNILMGALVMGLPNWVEGPKVFVTTFAVIAGVQVVLVAVAVVGLCFYTGLVEMGDLMVLGREETGGDGWDSRGSFMDA